ncbi:amidophosphoribosyltransferase [Tepidimicrobium xylanilyticum]|uniref:Amidophosphoribosyltransferase n=1 Tax=Tepidimicrobium xylanilyticum TaxID=1123352 RepID=A0A1H2Q5W8_9FIRM|nr:amidophosphoribosyltransferase [Tepidimicrobium xylanilyticum]SDW01829.1 amidophosphoribosyltransferase [Tepidimicrobium xylanilyticum]
MCGIIGIYSKEKRDVPKIIYYGLYALQHRGQVSAGMAVNNNGYIDYHKGLGLAYEVLDKDVLNRLRGDIGIGHVRTGSSVKTTTANAEPLVVGYKQGALALAYDGSLVNYRELREKMEDDGIIFQSSIDTEVIANLIARYHKEDIEQAIIKAVKDIKGSYALVLMTNDRLIGVRDPYGLKPLCIGKLGKDYILSSETCALDTIGAQFVRDVNPGEMVVIIDRDIKSIKTKEADNKNICLFEIIYLARPDSKLDGKSIYRLRREAGRNLAREHPVEGDIVISAPDSGTVAAIGYAEESKIPYDEGLIKNRYVGRTFIQPTQELREIGVRIKLNVLKENVEGKRIILVDDSIVRGTTMKRIVRMLKDAGAREVHVRIASPPVKHPCLLGMHTPNKENLIAAQKSIEEIRDKIGADSLSFLSLEGLLEAVGGENSYCTGCFSGQYPVDGDLI